MSTKKSDLIMAVRALAREEAAEEAMRDTANQLFESSSAEAVHAQQEQWVSDMQKAAQMSIKEDRERKRREQEAKEARNG